MIKKIKILITGAGSVMGQSIYKALSMADDIGCINIYFANSEHLGAGRFFNNSSAPVIETPIFPLAVDPHYLPFLDNYIKSNEIDIVFTGTQHELDKISSYRDATLKAATISSNIAHICNDKIKTSSVLQKYDIRVPITYSLNDYLENEIELGEVILKPNHSSSSRNIFACNNRHEIISCVKNIQLNTSKYLVQNRLHGEEYTSGCYIDRYSRKIHVIVLKRTLTKDGATYYGEVIHNDIFHNYISKVAQALISEGLDFGHINIQFIDTHEGPVFFEINGRLSSTEASKAKFGFNSCSAFVHNIVFNKEYTGWNIVRTGKFLRYYDEVYFDQ